MIAIPELEPAAMALAIRSDQPITSERLGFCTGHLFDKAINDYTSSEAC